MCRNIRPLFNFEPAATDEEIMAAATQYARKVVGGSAISQVNQAAFDQAVSEITSATTTLLANLKTTALPKNREVEATKAKARSIARFGTGKLRA